MTRDRRRWAVFVGVIALALAAIAAPYFGGLAEAHSALATASPANNEKLTHPPTRVILHFSEAPERKLTTIQVTDNNKNRVDTGDMAFDDNDTTLASIGLKPLDPGLYFVKWDNVSAVDGHPLDGSYPFLVLNADGTFPAGVTADSLTGASGNSGELLPKNVDSALKWISLLSLCTVAGAAFFLFAAMRPAASFLDDEDYVAVTDMVERWVITVSHVLLPAAFIASAFLLLLTVHRFTTSLSLWSYVTTVRTGEYDLARLALIVLALVGCDLLFLGNSRRKRTVGLVAMIVTSIAALFTYSLASHAAADNGKFWTVGSDFLHVLASAGWLGALAMVLVFVRWRRHALDDAARWLYIANVFDRFSVIAALSVAVILATGTFNGLAAVPTAGAMIHTTYGKVLLAKIALVLPLLGIAGVNAFLLKPRFVAAIDTLYQQGGTPSDATRAQWTPQLRRLRELLVPTVAAEIVLIVAVFASVGVLTQTATAKGEIAEQAAAKAPAAKFDQKASQGGINFDLTVSPNRVGLNDYQLNVTNADGTPATTVTLARLRFNYTDAPNAVAPSEILLNRLTPGDYKGTGSYFTTPGNWRVDMTIQRSDADDVSHAFVLPVAPAPPSLAASKHSNFSLPFTVFNWNEVAGATLALIGALALIYRRQINFGTVGYRATVTGATCVLLAGAVLAFGVHTHTAAVTNARGDNPVPANADSVAKGKELFQQNCVVCHGIDGRGDGPDAASLSPAPTDFRLHMPLHTDPQFYAFIHDGYAGTAMPAFGSAFSETDIWNLVNYLRASFSGTPSQ